MTCTNFPSTGLVADVTTHQVGNVTYLYKGGAPTAPIWEAITPPINLAQVHRRVTTVAEIESGVFSDGDLLEVSDRGTHQFKVKTGTADGYGRIDAGGGLIAEYVPIAGTAVLELDIVAFGAKVGGVINSTLPVQAALDFARTLVIETTTGIGDVNFPNKGGCTVTAPSGKFLIDQIEVPETVSFVGQGKNSTVFVSNFNGQIIRNKVILGDGTYDKTGIRLAHFGVKGDRTQANQVGIDTLRLFDCAIEELHVSNCGSHGVILRQAVTSNVRGLTSTRNVGAGFIIDEGVNSWTDLTPSGYPSNANVLYGCHLFSNDGAGLWITGRANGNRIIGGSYETNYLSSGDNVGYNIEIDCISFSRNLLDGIWTEGGEKAHIYVNHSSAGSSTDIINWRHFGSDAVDRALICDQGTVSVKDAFGHGDNYKLINGSIKPFRVNVGGGTAVITAENCQGSTITDNLFIEDENGNTVSSTYQYHYGRPVSGFNFQNCQPSTNAYTLDEYEEGTWTPTLSTDGTDFASVTYDPITGGRYTKIGNVVNVQGAIRTDAVDKAGASGLVVIGGLPFASSGNSPSTNDGYAAGSLSTVSGFVTNHPSGGLVFNGASRMHLLTRSAANGPTGFLAISDVGTGANANAVQFSLTYIASS